MKRTVDEIYIGTAGDSSVGIFPVNINIVNWGTIYDDVTDKAELEENRQLIADCFSAIFGEPAHVEYDFEIEEQEKMYDEAIDEASHED